LAFNKQEGELNRTHGIFILTAGNSLSGSGKKINLYRLIALPLLSVAAKITSLLFPIRNHDSN
jgi:hypothetical protein